MVRLRTLVLLSVTLLAACYDSPLERANPNDPDFDVTMSLQSTRDTVTRDNPWVAFTIVSDPVLEGYEPQWETTYASLEHQGSGVFRLATWPSSTFPIIVRARFQNRVVQRTIYAAPVPAP